VSFNADTEHIAGIAQLAFSGLGLYLDTDEANEGVRAFNQGRAPDFRGHRARASV
jgi:1,4-dihydroxy-2-naphthoyl-CoA synthase